jgi:AcrR family transcriptional regulator
MARAADGTKRASIIQTAFRAFGERGFRATTIQSIARRAGVAPGSVYTYFHDKDDLFRSTVEEGWDAFLGQLEGIRASREPFARKLRVLVDTGFQVLKENLPLLRGMLFEAGQRKLVQAKLDRVCESVERIVLGERGRTRVGAQWRRILKVTVVGILFSAASVPPERTDEEIRGLKEAVSARLADLGKRREQAGTPARRSR